MMSSRERISNVNTEKIAAIFGVLDIINNKWTGKSTLDRFSQFERKGLHGCRHNSISDRTLRFDRIKVELALMFDTCHLKNGQLG